MAITIREEQQSGMASTANTTFTTGAGMLTTDKLLLFHSSDFYTAANLGTPTGTAGTSWTLQASVDAGSNLGHTKVWTSDVAAAGAQTVIVNSTNTDEERFAALFVLTGAASGVDGIASTANGSASVSIVAPTVTPISGQTDDLLICFFGPSIQGGTTSVDLTMPGSMTAYAEVDIGGIWTARLAYEQLASAAATGTRTATSSATKSYQTVSVLIQSASPPDIPIRPTKVSDRGTVANVTAATTSALTITSPTAIAVGNYLIARVAVDNSGASGAAPGCTITDSRNTWTVLGPGLADPGAASAGTTAYLCYAKVNTAYQAADTITFNWGGISTTAKAIVLEEWSYIHPTNPIAVASTTNDSGAAASTTAVTISRTPTGVDQLVYTCLATEGIAGDTVGADSDTTNGTWAALTTTASADATATNNQRVSGAYKVVTLAGAQSWDSTITSRDWAAVAVVFNPPDPPPPPRKLVFEALVRSHYW